MEYKKLSYFLSFLLFFAALTSCEFNTVFSNFQKVDKEGWKVSEPMLFEFEIKNEEQPYDVHLAVRHDKNYEYSNLWLKISNETGTMLAEDEAVQFNLANKTGEWLGKCSNTYCTQKIKLKENYVFPDTGTYALTVSQHMRVDNLKHLKAVGLTIAKSDLDSTLTNQKP